MSGYIHSGINPMIKVEPYKHENKVLVANKYGNAKVGSLKENDITNAIQSIGNLNNLNTTDKSNVVAAINEVVAGSSTEEQFIKVYENTLTESASNIGITSSDIDGVYVDIVIYIRFPYPFNISSLTVVFFNPLNPQRQIIWIDGIQSIPEGQSCYGAVFGLISLSGLMFSSNYVVPEVGPVIQEFSGFCPPASEMLSMISPEYPTTEHRGIGQIGLQGNFLTDTIITVYARRKVAEAVDIESGNNGSNPNGPNPFIVN